MIFSLLDDTQPNGSPWLSFGLLGVIAVLLVVWFVFSYKKRKKQEKEAKDLVDAVKPGNKVKTIGGICGIVVEVDNEENTFVLETGTEQSGKSYLKFDRQAIYQTDAVVEKKDDVKEAKNAKTEEPLETVQAEAVTDVVTEQEAAPEVVEEKEETAKKGKKSEKKEEEKQIKF